MNIDEYFNEIQEYIKQNIDDKSQIDLIIKSLDDTNIQATVNQDFNNTVPIEDCGAKILNLIGKPNETQAEPNQINGERGMNTMEHKILKYDDFILENKKTLNCVNGDSGENTMDD